MQRAPAALGIKRPCRGQRALPINRYVRVQQGVVLIDPGQTRLGQFDRRHRTRPKGVGGPFQRQARQIGWEFPGRGSASRPCCSAESQRKECPSGMRIRRHGYLFLMPEIVPVLPELGQSTRRTCRTSGSGSARTGRSTSLGTGVEQRSGRRARTRDRRVSVRYSMRQCFESNNARPRRVQAHPFLLKVCRNLRAVAALQKIAVVQTQTAGRHPVSG